MAGGASGGQKVTPDPNVFAPGGTRGFRWGANGGGQDPIGGGVTGDTGWDERVAPAQSRGQTVENYEQSPIPVTVVGAPTQSVLTQQANAALTGTSFDDALAAGGSYQG
ncbi:MAG: hypothetical protein ACREHV_14445 [Rhizomicrobium sp.]